MTAYSRARLERNLDPALLRVAGLELADLLDLSQEPTWQVVRRDARRYSVLYRLRAEHERGRTPAFYKTEHPRGNPSEGPQYLDRVTRARQSLDLEQQLAPRIAAVLGEASLAFDRVLAVDRERLTAVRLAVPGRPLRPLRNHVIAGRRRRYLEILQDVGRAIRLVEQTSARSAPVTAVPRIVRRAEELLGRASVQTPSWPWGDVESALEGLLAALDPARDVVWSHGDLSRTNILVAGRKVGIIDFTWRPFLHGEAIAYLATRLAVERWTPGSWRDLAVSRLFEGYGWEWPATTRLALTLRLLRQLAEPPVQGRQWALQRLEALVAGETLRDLVRGRHAGQCRRAAGR